MEPQISDTAPALSWERLPRGVAGQDVTNPPLRQRQRRRCPPEGIPAWRNSSLELIPGDAGGWQGQVPAPVAIPGMG